MIEVPKISSTVHGVENRGSHAKSTVIVQLLGVPAWKGDHCIHMYVYECLVNGVCMYGLAIVQAIWSLTGIQFVKRLGSV